VELPNQSPTGVEQTSVNISGPMQAIADRSFKLDGLVTNEPITAMGTG